MRLDIRDVSLADSSGKKLAGFNRLLIDISPIELFRRTIAVEEAVLDQPWVDLEIGENGQLSLLNTFPKGRDKPTDTIAAEAEKTSKPFLVAIDSMDIIGGNIVFATQQDSLRIKAHGLSVAASGETGSLSADASLALDSVVLEYNEGNLNIRDLSLTTKMRNMDIDTVNLHFRTTHSAFALTGRASSLTDSLIVNLSVAADLALSEIRSATGLKEPLSGSTKLRMQATGKASNPDLGLYIACDGGNIWGYPVDSLTMNARLSDRVLKLMSMRVTAAGGSADVTGGVDIRGMFPGGFFAAPGSIQKIDYDFTISSDEISLAELVPTLSGTAGISIALKGNGALPDSLDASLAMTADVVALRLDTSTLQLDASIACSTTVSQGTAHIHRFNGKLGSTELSLRGAYGITDGSMDATLDISVPELYALLGFAGIDSVSGSAIISARVGGYLKNPQAEIDLRADTIVFGYTNIGSFTLDVGLDRSGTTNVKSLVLTNGSSRLTLAGSAQVLEKGMPLPVDQMTFDLSLLSKRLDIRDFVDSIDGTVDIDATVKGTIDDPRGHVRIHAIDFSALGQHVEEIALDALLEDQRVNINPLRIMIEPGQELTATGWTSLKDSFSVALSVPGIRLNTIDALSDVDSLDGVLSMDMQTGGTFTRPEARGKLAVRDIRAGAVALDDIALQLDLHNQQAEVTGMSLGKMHAAYNLDTKAFSANLSFKELLLEPYLALAGKDLYGALTADIKIAGNADSITDINSSLHIANLYLNYKDVRILETKELEATLEKKNYTVPGFNIMLAGEGPLKGHAQGFLEGPHDIALKGIVPLSVMRHFSPEFPDIEGHVALDFSLKGTIDDPELMADMHMQNIGMTVPGVTQRLHSLNGLIHADRTTVRIGPLRGNLDDGVINMKAKLNLDGLALSDVQAEITLENLPVGIPDMLDLVLDAKLRVLGTPDTTQVVGDIFLIDGLYYQDFVINPLAGMGQRKRKESARVKENNIPFLKNMRFDVDVQARSPLQVDNNIVHLAVSPDLQLMGSLQAPALNGRTNVEEGTITYHKKLFTVERGVIDFVNPYAIEPKIDIQGSVSIRGWLIRIIISGSPNDLLFRLACNDPALEDQDILSLLILGKTTAELQSNIESIGSMGQSNEQMLASLVSSTFGEDIKKATGLDMLEVETADNRDEDPDRIAVTMGKQITKRLGTKYTVESKGTDIVQRATAEYRILQNLFIAGFQDTKGVYGGELRLTWERR